MQWQFPEHVRNEGGQAIIQVTVSILVLIAFVALAIDAGNTYAQRRQMQNAADAGALAGARELCLGSSAATATAAARTYMINNGTVEFLTRTTALTPLEILNVISAMS